MEKKHCQMKTQDGLLECGLLIGSVCKADRERPFTVTRQINEILSIVGCASWSKYLEWTNDGKDKVQELPVQQVGTCGNDKDSEESKRGRVPVSMHVLQEGVDTHRESTGRNKPSGGHMNKCEVCGEQAVACDTGSTVRDGNHWYCLKHHQDWCKCITHENMVKAHEAKNGNK